MRIANATDLYGNPYLTAASIGSSVETAVDRKSTRLNSSHTDSSRMPSSA